MTADRVPPVLMMSIRLLTLVSFILIAVVHRVFERVFNTDYNMSQKHIGQQFQRVQRVGNVECVGIVILVLINAKNNQEQNQM